MSLDGQNPPQSDNRMLDFVLSALVGLLSLVTLFTCTSPEFSFDEADYAINSEQEWTVLRESRSYDRHGHGPLKEYLAKFGREFLPTSFASMENRSRFFHALVGSAGLGALYFLLRTCFRASRWAALAGSGLLLFSGIRNYETYLLGPHFLMQACTILLLSLGYHWRKRATWKRGIVFGMILGFGAISMAYVIPVVLFWLVGMSLSGTGWICLVPYRFKVTPHLFVTMGVAALVTLAFFPNAIIHRDLYHDFRMYAAYVGCPTLVYDLVFDHTPRWAAAYWLFRLELPLLLSVLVILPMSIFAIYRRRSFSDKHIYFGVTFSLFLATMLTAHLTGARTMLQFITVSCLVTGGLIDDAFQQWRRGSLIAGAVILTASVAFLVWLGFDPHYIPVMRTSGYRAFVAENSTRLAEKTDGVVCDRPIIEFYMRQAKLPFLWRLGSPNEPLQRQTKYFWVSEVTAALETPGGPIHQVKAEGWKAVWSIRPPRSYGYTLYENPRLASHEK